eukprot:RCo045889
MYGWRAHSGVWAIQGNRGDGMHPPSHSVRPSSSAPLAPLSIFRESTTLSFTYTYTYPLLPLLGSRLTHAPTLLRPEETHWVLGACSGELGVGVDQEGGAYYLSLCVHQSNDVCTQCVFVCFFVCRVCLFLRACQSPLCVLALCWIFLLR